MTRAPGYRPAGFDRYLKWRDRQMRGALAVWRVDRATVEVRHVGAALARMIGKQRRTLPSGFSGVWDVFDFDLHVRIWCAPEAGVGDPEHPSEFVVVSGRGGLREVYEQDSDGRWRTVTDDRCVALADRVVRHDCWCRRSMLWGYSTTGTRAEWQERVKSEWRRKHVAACRDSHCRENPRLKRAHEAFRAAARALVREYERHERIDKTRIARGQKAYGAWKKEKHGRA